MEGLCSPHSLGFQTLVTFKCTAPSHVHQTHAFSRSPTLFPCTKISFWEQNWETPDVLHLSAARCLQCSLRRLRKLEALIPTYIIKSHQCHNSMTSAASESGLRALSSESQKVCPVCPQCIFPWWLVAFRFCLFNKQMPVLGEEMNYMTGYPDGGI